jgi:hypothetical protein
MVLVHRRDGGADIADHVVGTRHVALARQVPDEARVAAGDEDQPTLARFSSIQS